MDAVNKCDLYHMAKMMVCWDFYEDELMVNKIDSNACSGTNIDAANVVDFL